MQHNTETSFVINMYYYKVKLYSIMITSINYGILLSIMTPLWLSHGLQYIHLTKQQIDDRSDDYDIYLIINTFAKWLDG